MNQQAAIMQRGSTPHVEATLCGVVDARAGSGDRLPALLAAYRQRHGLSMQRAGAAVGAGRTVWRTWETGSVVPGPANLAALSALLAVPPEQLRLATGADRVRRGHDCSCGALHGLVKLRTQAGLTSRALASLVHTSPSTITRWETGERCCGVADRDRLAAALQVTREQVDEALGPLAVRAGMPCPGLLTARRSLRMTQSALADLAGVDPATVRRWEQRGVVPAGLIDLLVDVLGPAVLLPASEPRPTAPPPLPPLRNLRHRAGLGGRVTAARVGIAMSTLYAWERGVRRPGWDSLRRLAGVYRVPLVDVFAAAGQSAPRHVRSGPWPDDVLADVLPDVRRWYGLTQGQLGELLGVRAGAVADWEAGRHVPGVRARQALDRIAAGG